MPYTILENDEFQLTLYCQDGPDQGSANGIRLRANYLVGAGITDQAAVDSLSATWAALLKPFFATDTQYLGATLRRVAGAGEQPITRWSQSGVGSGVLPLPTLPRQVAALITLRTDFGGKKFRGRMYIPFLAASLQAANATGEPTVAAQGLIDAVGLEAVAGQSFIVGGATIVLTYGLHPAGGAFAGYTSYEVRERWATQIRRGDFGQMNRSPFL